MCPKTAQVEEHNNPGVKSAASNVDPNVCRLVETTRAVQVLYLVGTPCVFDNPYLYGLSPNIIECLEFHVCATDEAHELERSWIF